MKISLITPASNPSRGGNRTTAVRWARIFRSLGHRVRIATAYADEAADLMVALHAWRSAGAIERFHERHPQRPLVVALTGTDIYSFIHTHRDTTLRSLDLAHRLVGLHELVPDAVPKPYHDKLRIIYKSAPPLRRRMPPLQHAFEVLVIGHLREEKDPLRAAEAARRLPQASRLRVVHLGAAHERHWAERARAEMARNPRYVWRGEVPGWKGRQASARAPPVGLGSIMEGGACGKGWGRAGGGSAGGWGGRAGCSAATIPATTRSATRWRWRGSSGGRSRSWTSSRSCAAVAPPAPSGSIRRASANPGAS